MNGLRCVKVWLALLASVAAQAQQTPSLAVRDAEARNATKAIVARKIILVGDSTTQVGSGWGGSFCATHVVSFLACVNLGRGGRSTFSYRAEGSWALALNEIRVPGFAATYVLIQFGHNDQPGKPGRSTDLISEFPDNLRRYVVEARAAGATPVLVTPLTRRSFRNGVLQDDLAPWARSVTAVASELKVPLVDLHASSMAAVQAMGPVASLSLAQVAPPPEVIAAAQRGTTIAAPSTTPVPANNETVQGLAAPTVAFDYTHLGAQGAAVFSAQVASGLARAVPELQPLLFQ